MAIASNITKLSYQGIETKYHSFDFTIKNIKNYNQIKLKIFIFHDKLSSYISPYKR